MAGGAPSGVFSIFSEGSDDEDIASLSSCSDTVPVRTSPEALVSKASTAPSLIC